MRRHRWFQPAGWYRRLTFGMHKALPGFVSGLTLHAAVRCGADDRPSLKQLCRYITRPALAKLVKRVFDLDLQHCPNCGGELKIIAAILERPVIEKILTHLELQARAPPRSPARGQALQAEPGHKQSSRLFVPGEESGHWPGALCKGPDAAQL